MIKSAAEILAEIDDATEYEKRKRALLRKPNPVDIIKGAPDRERAAKPRPKPRTDRRERLIDREADARAYRLAAIEAGVYLLLPRDLYGKGES